MAGGGRDPETLSPSVISGETSPETLGRQLFPGQPQQGQRFVQRLRDLHSKAAGCDFLVIFNPGGFGYAPLADDAEWGGVVQGMVQTLQSAGQRVGMVEHLRTRNTLAGWWRESRDYDTFYSTAAPELAWEVSWLTQQSGVLRVILTGMSSGGALAHRAATLLMDNPRVYAIVAGVPGKYRVFPDLAGELVMEDNGVEPDVWVAGGYKVFWRANLGRLPSLKKPPGGALKMGPLWLRAPGHEYTWGHEAVRTRVVSFLRERVLGEARS